MGGWAQKLPTFQTVEVGGGCRIEGMLVSEGRKGLPVPEQKSPQGTSPASGLGHCLSWLVDLAPEG